MDSNPNAGDAAKTSELKATVLLNIRQVAKLLNYSRGWVEEAVLEGRIKATRLGGQYRITAEEVERVKREGVLPGKSKKKVKDVSQIPAEAIKPAQPVIPAAAPAPPPAAPRIEEKKAPVKPAAAPAPVKPPEKSRKEEFDLFGWLR